MLNDKLEELYCFDNEITHLPLLNDSLINIVFNNNPIYEVLFNNTINLHHVRHYYEVQYNDEEYYPYEIMDDMPQMLHLQKSVQTLHKFKSLFFTLKYKQKFRDFLWDKVRRPKIEEKYHPSNLQKIMDELSEEDDLTEMVDRL